MQPKNNLKKNLKRIICIALAIMFAVVGSFYIGETYSRYRNIGFDEPPSATVAKWYVSLRNGDAPISKSIPIKFNRYAEGNVGVTNAKLVPGGQKVKAQFDLDLSGAEVAIVYNMTLDLHTFERMTGGSVTFDVKKHKIVDGLLGAGEDFVLGQDWFVPLERVTYRFVFTLGWKNIAGAEVADTRLALEGSLKLALNVKVRQYIDKDTEEPLTRGKQISNISYFETQATKPRETMPKDIKYTPPEQDLLSENPERGFYSTSYLPLIETGLPDKIPNTTNDFVFIDKSNTSKMLYLKVDLTAFSGNMNASGVDKELTPDALTELDKALEKIKQNDNTVIIRFVYDGNAKETIPKKDSNGNIEMIPGTDVKDDFPKVEPSQDMILKHINSLSQIFKKYKETINVIQLGFYGLWGECHYNTEIYKKLKNKWGNVVYELQHPEYLAQATQALLDATEGTEITIALRRPAYYGYQKGIKISTENPSIIKEREMINAIKAYIPSPNDSDPERAKIDKDDHRLCIYNDGYGSSINDFGTYETTWELLPTGGYGDVTDRDGEVDWVGKRSSRAFFGGEAIATVAGVQISGAMGQYSVPSFFVPEAYRLHTDYLNWEWNQTLHKEWNDKVYAGENALGYIEKHLGYRLVVKEVRSDATVLNGNVFSIDLTVNNVGFGNVVKSKKAEVIIVGASGVTQTLNVAFDVRDYLSQATIKKTLNVALPTLSAGEYKVYLRVSSGEQLRSGKFYSAIRFANDGLWHEDLQANFLTKFKVA